MIIHTPEIRIENEEICISARVELQKPDVTLPTALWFKFPREYEQYISDRADGFVVSLLLLAMQRGEDIEVRGSLSSRLVYGMQEYQRIFNSWFPQNYKLINIKCSDFDDAGLNGRKKVSACAFSGGVDSFYTLWSHLPQNEHIQDYQVSYGLFVHGFDIPLKDERTYQIASENYCEMLQRFGLHLLTARTNMRQFRPDWNYTHGAATIGVALILGRLISRFFMPASKTYTTLEPWGADPMIDPLLSTETLEVLHDGAGASRMQKIATLAEWSETYPRLRVCWKEPDGLINCCRCDKCVRTMIALEVLGVLDQYRTFPLPLTRRAIHGCSFLTEHQRLVAKQMIHYANKINKGDIAFDIRYALLRDRYRDFFDKIKQKAFSRKRG